MSGCLHVWALASQYLIHCPRVQNLDMLTCKSLPFLDTQVKFYLRSTYNFRVIKTDNLHTLHNIRENVDTNSVVVCWQPSNCSMPSTLQKYSTRIIVDNDGNNIGLFFRFLLVILFLMKCFSCCRDLLCRMASFRLTSSQLGLPMTCCAGWPPSV